MALDKSQFVALRIRELARNYFKLTAPAAAGFAPTIRPQAGEGLSFTYNFVSGSGARLVGEPAVLTTESQLLTEANIALGSETINLDAFDLGVFTVSDSTADAFGATVDEGGAANEFVEALMSRAYANHSLTTRQRAAAELPQETLPIDGDYADALDDVIMAVLLGSGYRPNTIIMGPETVVKLSRQDFVRDFPSVSIVAADKARTGWAGENDVRSYFAGKHGLNLVVDETSWQPGVGQPGEFVWAEGTAALGYVGGGFRQSTMQTLIQRNNELVRIEVRRNSGRQRVGFNVPAEGIWKAHAPNPESGRFLTAVAPSS